MVRLFQLIVNTKMGNLKIVLEILKLFHKFGVWFFDSDKKANIFRWCFLLITVLGIRYHDKFDIYKYVDNAANTKTLFHDPKPQVQTELLDLNKACGQGCHSILIALSEKNGSLDGKPWSVYGYVGDIKQIIEISSIEMSNPVNYNRFSIFEDTYKELVINAGDVPHSLSIELIEERYPDIASLLRLLKAPISKYIYYVQFSENKAPLWVIGLAVHKDFTPRCNYFTNGCNELLVSKSKSLLKLYDYQ